ncbi:MAG: class I SAM-dependent methyltransferase [Spirochaetales bacterium]|nr:class I SAM-dependent methyltransferase [Spirochaetales bacterium]
MDGVDEKVLSRALNRIGWGTIPPDQWRIDLEPGFLEIWDRVKPFTMTSAERGYGLYKGVEYLHANKISGALVECGVWKGGSCMLMALSFMARGEMDRLLYLYDTFTGMTEPTDEDVIAWNNLSVSRKMAEEKRAGRDSFGSWAVGFEDVRQNILSIGYPEERLCMISGDVEKTLKTDPFNQEIPEKIALLRLDTDWYESTKAELEILYPKLVPGGILVIDDYGHFKGARRAVDEYFEGLPAGARPFLSRLDYTGRMAVKPGPLE